MTDNQYNICPRVLIISHNVFSNNTSMGKTMSTYFENWDKGRIAQLYFHAEIPTSTICERYYSFSDKDALQSIIIRWKTGTKYGREDVKTSRNDANDTGKLTSVYNFGRRRYPLTYIARDTMWRLSAWESEDLYEWIKSFAPDVIFFASGDYSFAYTIADRISTKLSIPMVACCFDDYYLFNINNDTVIGRLRYKSFMNTVSKTLRKSKYILTVCEEMSKQYSHMFGKECPVLYTGAKQYEHCEEKNKERTIVYLGGLGLHRNLQLIDIGNALLDIDDPNLPQYVDVYSGETDHSLLDGMTIKNGIRFHGAVSGDKVDKIIQNSMAVIHTESFEEPIMNRVRYSISTKIPECIASGTCVFAYGPRGIASIDYLYDNNAAIVVDRKDELKNGLLTLFKDDKKRHQIIDNAIHLSEKNHRIENINNLVRDVLSKAAGTSD